MQNGPSYHNLNPTSFLERSAFVYPDKPAIVYKDQHFTYAQFNERVNRLAGALKQAGVKKGDRVAFFVPNIPAMLEAHFGPMRMGAILVALNIRLSDERFTLLRMSELKQPLEMRLPDDAFTYEELKAVVRLLVGPGHVW